MAMWMGDEPVTDDVLFKDFPEQCFPEIEGLRLRIGAKGLHVCGDDADWALQSDISLAIGSGCMVFFYTGELRFMREDPHGRTDLSLQEAKQSGLPHPEELLKITRGTPWEFMFSLSGQGRLTIYAEVISLSWRPEETE